MGSITAATSALFTPIKIGATQLKHRIVFAPCTRVRSTNGHVPILPLHKRYYEQRASVPGTLLISEAALIAEKAGGHNNVPGIYSDDQIKAWKEITDAIHAKGSSIFIQLWAMGRAARLEHLHGHSIVSASPIRLSTAAESSPVPRALTLEEVEEYVGLYASAARNAMTAGFDGVEIHCANGYLIDQFLQDVSNKRTDKYGGSIENRSRFGLEVVDAVVQAIGADRTSVRLSPWSVFQDMKMKDPIPQFDHFISSLGKHHPDLAYVHFIEATIKGNDDTEAEAGETIDRFREIWGSRPFMINGGFDRDSAIETADKHGDIVAFGRPFIANPDLPFRLRQDIQLNTPDRATFFAFRENPEDGYTDYPFSKEFIQA